MAYQYIKTSRDGAAFVITFNRPERRNAISVATMDELIDAAQSADAMPDVFGIILTGGMEYFSAGADLNDALAIKGAADGLAYFKRWHRLCDVYENLTKPVFAAIEGFCMTGGCEFAMACDIRIAAEDATFAITSAKIGTVAGAGGTQRLARLVGPSKAIEIMFSADPIDAAEAHRIGLINRKVAKGQAVEETKKMIKVYENRAPLSLAFIKRVVYRGLQMDLASALEFEAFLVSTIYSSQDRKEGISAFLEKRPAKFTGQ